MNFLSGKKTYIVAFVMAALNLAMACGWISAQYQYDINMVLSALGLGTLRAGISKVE